MKVSFARAAASEESIVSPIERSIKRVRYSLPQIVPLWSSLAAQRPKENKKKESSQLKSHIYQKNEKIKQNAYPSCFFLSDRSFSTIN